MTAPDAVANELAAAAQPAACSRGGQFWILRRLGFGILILFLVSVLVFAATQALPSDPARAILGRNATPERLAAVREELGLRKPLPQQYTDWLGGVLTGDLGRSLTAGGVLTVGLGSSLTVQSARIPVTKLIGKRAANSLILLMLVAVISFPVSILLGGLAAIRRDRFFDKTTLLVSLGLTALPEFVIGMGLVILFSTTVFTVLPAVALIPPRETPFSHLTALVLPTATLVLAVVPYLYRLVRASMIDVLESEYVQMARLKGMPERIVMRRHALPNALIPLIQASAVVLAYLLGGVVVVEYLFGYPGLGRALTDAIASRDLPVIQAIVLLFAAAVVVFNLVADVLTVLVTPRLRIGGT